MPSLSRVQQPNLPQPRPPAGSVVKYVVTVQLYTERDADPRSLAASLAASWAAILAAQLPSQQQAAPPSWPPLPRAAGPAPGGSQAQQRAAAAAGRKRCRPSLRARGPLLQAKVCPGDLPEALAWLSAQPQVHWLEPTPRVSKRDLLASLVVESGVVSAAAAAQPARLASHGMWARGLDGSGQVLGISDSGVDLDSCYFFDPLVSHRRLGGDGGGSRACALPQIRH